MNARGSDWDIIHLRFIGCCDSKLSSSVAAIAFRRWCDVPRYMAAMSAHMPLLTWSPLVDDVVASHPPGGVLSPAPPPVSSWHCTAACFTRTGIDEVIRADDISCDDELLMVSVRWCSAPLAAVEDVEVWLDVVAPPLDMRWPRPWSDSLSASDLDFRNHGYARLLPEPVRWWCATSRVVSIVSMLSSND